MKKTLIQEYELRGTHSSLFMTKDEVKANEVNKGKWGAVVGFKVLV
jgi:hypothetical protein